MVEKVKNLNWALYSEIGLVLANVFAIFCVAFLELHVVLCFLSGGQFSGFFLLVFTYIVCVHFFVICFNKLYKTLLMMIALRNCFSSCMFVLGHFYTDTKSLVMRGAFACIIVISFFSEVHLFQEARNCTKV